MSISKGLDLIKNGSEDEVMSHRFSVQLALLVLKLRYAILLGCLFAIPLGYYGYSEYVKTGEIEMIFLFVLLPIVGMFGLWAFMCLTYLFFYPFMRNIEIKRFIIREINSYRAFK